MIGIKINNEHLDLLPDTSVNVKLYNPIFADGDIIPGSFSLPFDLPGGEVSGKNGRLVGHPDVPENIQSRFVEKDTLLLFDGLQYKRGDLVIESYDRGRRYKGNFKFGLATISDELKTITLKQLVDEQVTITGETVNKSISIKPNTGRTAPYQIEINGTTYEENTLSALATAINNDPPDPGVQATYFASGSTNGIAGEHIKLDPDEGADDIYSEFSVYNPVESDLNFWLFGSDLFLDYYQGIEAFLDGYFSEPYDKDYIRFPLYFNNYPYAHLNAYSGNAVNWTDTGGVSLGDPNDFLVKAYDYHPFVTLKHVFDKMAARYSIRYRGDFVDDPAFAKALIYNTHSLRRVLPYMNRDLAFYETVFNVSDLVPAHVKVTEMLKALQKKYNLAVYYDEDTRSIVLNKRDALLLNTSHEDWTGVSGPIEDNGMAAAAGVKLTAVQDDNDELSEEDIYTVGDPDLEIETELGSLAGDGSVAGYGVSGPVVSQEPRSEFSFRLFFYEGLAASSGVFGAYDYPKASYKDWEVRFDGVSGLGATVWANYLRFLTGRKQVSSEMRLELRHLLGVDWEQKVMVGGVPYFVKSIDATFGMRGVKVRKVELYTV